MVPGATLAPIPGRTGAVVMGSAMAESATKDLLIQQMVNTITELDGQTAVENALEWLRRECDCERAMFYQFKGPLLLTFITSNVDDIWGKAYRHHELITQDPVIRYYRNHLGGCR
ncbi:LuxR family transcriptional regulator, partial [Pseudomonas cannabina]